MGRDIKKTKRLADDMFHGLGESGEGSGSGSGSGGGELTPKKYLHILKSNEASSGDYYFLVLTDSVNEIEEGVKYDKYGFVDQSAYYYSFSHLSNLKMLELLTIGANNPVTLDYDNYSNYTLVSLVSGMMVIYQDEEDESGMTMGEYSEELAVIPVYDYE